MTEFKLEMPENTECAGCGGIVQLDVDVCGECGHAALPRMNFLQFWVELEQMRIVDARFGGLVIGRTGPEDDIPMYRHQDGIFSAVGLMQGGEYLMSQSATNRHRARIDQINLEKGEGPFEYNLRFTESTSVINTNVLAPYGGLWISRGQYVINRFATAKYLTELEMLNASSLPVESD